MSRTLLSDSARIAITDDLAQIAAWDLRFPEQAVDALTKEEFLRDMIHLPGKVCDVGTRAVHNHSGFEYWACLDRIDRQDANHTLPAFFKDKERDCAGPWWKEAR
jgi:hypothetical protein